MNSADLWAIYVAKNPKMGLNDDTHITLTSRGLKKLFDTTWERAHEAGFENGKAWEKMRAEQDGYGSGDPLGGLSKNADIFSQMFKGKP